MSTRRRCDLLGHSALAQHALGHLLVLVGPPSCREQQVVAQGTQLTHSITNRTKRKRTRKRRSALFCS